MRKIREYDFNIYCPEDDVITLSAYKLSYAGDGLYSTNYSDWTTIRFNKNLAKHKECVAWLLKRVCETEVYEDMDVWAFTVRELENTAPPMIAEWVASLPEYEVEEQVDIVEQAKEVGKPYGEV